MPTTVANPGNIVVPLSQIIDQLQGKLSSSDIDQLLYAIVSKRKTAVGPGDLITSDLINQVLTDLESLNTQVAALSVGGGATTGNTAAITTFHDAWGAYGGLVKNGTFLPPETSPEAIASSAEITAYLQDVMYAALAGGGLGYFGASSALIEAFKRLYDAQNAVVVLFNAPLSGVGDLTSYKQFATLLNTILTVDGSDGKKSLKTAVAGADLAAAIDAQNRIDGMVRNQSGDVTTGNLEVKYLGAVGTTETLVLGGGPVVYRFSVANKTNRTLDIQLQAEFLAPKAAWSTGLSIIGLDGQARSHVLLSAFDPSHPDDTAATQEIRVAAATPGGAVAGDTGTLQLTASVAPPIDVKAFATRTLTVANAPVPQTPGIIAFSADSPVASRDVSTLPKNTQVTLAYSFTFSKGIGPASRDFRFRIEATAPIDPANFFVQFMTTAIDAAASTTSKLVSAVIPMTDGSTASEVVRVIGKTSGTALTYTATIESAVDGVIATLPPVTITVQ